MPATRPRLTPQELRALDHVSHQARTLASVAQVLNVSVSQARRVLYKLEQRGLVRASGGWYFREED